MAVNTLLFRLLVAIVLLAPLPLGSNRPWSWSLLAVAVGLLLAVWSVRAAMGRVAVPIPPAFLLPVGLPYALVLGWAALQTSSVTPPSLWHPMWAEATPALGLAGGPGNGLGNGLGNGMISADPAMTWAAVLRLACYAGIFWLAVQFGRDRGRAREAVVALCIAGTVYATYGLTVHLAGWENILWLKKWAYAGDLTATFVNRNAYGAYAGLGVVCCIGLFVNALRPRQGSQSPGAYDLVETLLLRAMPYLACGLVIGTALLLSHSRGAFLSTGLALGVLLILLSAAGLVPRRMALPLVGAVVLVALVTVSASGDGTITRLAEQTSVEHDSGRTNVYRLTMDAIADAPYTGMGLGTFKPAFRMYRDTTLLDPVVWEFAHNVPLELAMELGVPAAALLGLSLAVIAGVCLRGLMVRRRDRLYPALAVASMVLLGAHGLVDFSVQIPAVAATFALLLGLGFAQSWNTRTLEPASSGD
ncbi:hypothetical protein TSH100_08460 [Azospirillum sp. TSH100]|nr:O-antigen ligase family protein [Azospirillum sp. TSH100]PWC88157.1 hypothetical protein TSH100_08460 [Azospirillum sp. TSH100]